MFVGNISGQSEVFIACRIVDHFGRGFIKNFFVKFWHEFGQVMTSVNELGDIQVCYLFSEIWQSWEMSEEFFISLQIISLKLPKTCCLKLYFKIRQTSPVWLLISLVDGRLGFREMSSKCYSKVLRCIFLLWKVSQSHWLSVWRSLTENRAAVMTRAKLPARRRQLWRSANC